MTEEQIKKALELINLKALCKQYNLGYDHMRHTLSGRFPMTDKTRESLSAALKDFATRLQAFSVNK